MRNSLRLAMLSAMRHAFDHNYPASYWSLQQALASHWLDYRVMCVQFLAIDQSHAALD
jgi:hypothetical protein